MIYSLTYRNDLFQFINEDDAKELNNVLTSDRIIEMIDILLNTTKEYKQLNDIKPLFEVTLLKLSATKDGTPAPRIEEVTPQPKIIENTAKVEEKPVEIKKVEPIINEVKVEAVNKEEQKARAEEIAPEVKLSKKALVYKSALMGDHFAFDNHTIIRIMVSSKKDNKNYFLEHWKEIKKLISHPVLGKYASLIADAYPLVVSNKILLIEFQLQTMVEKANLVENQAMLQNVIETALGKRLFVYGVSRKESVDLQMDYRNLYELSKLPKANDDDFILEEEEI